MISLEKSTTEELVLYLEKFRGEGQWYMSKKLPTELVDEIIHRFALEVKQMSKEARGNYGICRLISDKHSTIIDKFFNIKNDGEFRKNFMSISAERMYQIFDKWEYFSSFYNYPVPSTKHKPEVGLNEPKIGPHKAFSDLHKWEGEYGELRTELLDFIISNTDKNNGHWLRKWLSFFFIKQFCATLFYYRWR
ncbi:hypothetical protein TH2_130 [Shewanella phage Thanatos-2]|nr:hypothetical protein TH2_130 [Shewanella phage Thanatos-2]